MLNRMTLSSMPQFLTAPLLVLVLVPRLTVAIDGYKSFKFGITIEKAKSIANQESLCKLEHDTPTKLSCTLTNNEFGKSIFLILTFEGDKSDPVLSEIGLYLGDYTESLYKKTSKHLAAQYGIKRKHTSEDRRLASQGVLNSINDYYGGGEVQLRVFLLSIAPYKRIAVFFQTPEKAKEEERINRTTMQWSKEFNR